jgi:hypothetical protein
MPGTQNLGMSRNYLFRKYFAEGIILCQMNINLEENIWSKKLFSNVCQVRNRWAFLRKFPYFCIYSRLLLRICTNMHKNTNPLVCTRAPPCWNNMDIFIEGMSVHMFVDAVMHRCWQYALYIRNVYIDMHTQKQITKFGKCEAMFEYKQICTSHTGPYMCWHAQYTQHHARSPRNQYARRCTTCT